jgi:hypothetical protein
VSNGSGRGPRPDPLFVRGHAWFVRNRLLR